MTILAKTKIQCPNAGRGYHAVALHQDGSITCDCKNGVEAGQSYAGRLMLGASPIEGVRGCGVLVALVEGAEILAPMLRSKLDTADRFGGWRESVAAYRQNRVFLAAIDRATGPERHTIDKLLLNGAERAGYQHALGKRKFREEFRTVWDVPVTEMDRLPVSSFDDDPWRVPYMPGWLDVVGQERTVIDGKLICGVDPTQPDVVFAVTRNVDWDGHMHWVRRHTIRRGKLVEVLS